MPDNPLRLLEIAAERLEYLLDEVVFVGGATLALLIPNPAVVPVRPTTDVDVIVEMCSYYDYVALSKRLKRLNFAEDDRPGAPICRWVHGELILDVLPTEVNALGFGNRWLWLAFQAAQTFVLPSRRSIRVITVPFFLATKIEAFRGRGQHDFLSSRDLEDFVSIVDARDTILTEINEESNELRDFLANAVQELLSESQFVDALPGYLLPDEVSQQRLPQLRQKLKSISLT